MIMKRLTIFTPTYNRAYIINILFDSLKRQTFNDFEWIVIDDGSTDNTEELIHKIISSEHEFPIVYKKIMNKGKHNAINQGVQLATGRLFFIVDSDDSLPCDALQTLQQYERSIPCEKKEKFAALVNSYSEGIRYDATFPMRTGTSDLMSIFGSSQTPSRLDVNYEIVRKNTEFLKKFLANNLGIEVRGSELYFSGFDKWIEDINEIRSNRYGYTFHQEIFSLYRSYLQDLSDPSLKEVRANSNDILTIYMKTRYFLASLDKAIMSLPWANVTMFLNNHLIQAMNYMEISSKGGVQEFLFGGQYSLIRPTVEDYIEILLRQYLQNNDLDPKSVKQQQESFERNCASMFSEE